MNCAMDVALADEIRRAIERAGMTQAELAERLDTQPPEVSRMLSENGNPTLKRLRDIARITGSDLVIEFKPHTH